MKIRNFKSYNHSMLAALEPKFHNTRNSTKLVLQPCVVQEINRHDLLQLLEEKKIAKFLDLKSFTLTSPI
jgi:hypothetical protein